MRAERTLNGCRVRAVIALWATGITALAAAAQTGVAQGTAPGPRFEVASIKPNREAVASGGTRTTAGRFTATATLPLELVRDAYQVERTRIVGLPDWARRERFDVAATMPVDATREQRAAMLRSLLAERFTLRAHTETRPVRVYVLTRVRPDGNLGPGMRPSTVVCGDAKPRCGERNTPRGTYRATGIRWPADVLISSELPFAVDAPVIDRTGIAGQYDIDLEWADPTATIAGQAATAERPSLFTALRQQLGLQLEPATEPIDVLVIDSIRRPTPD